jgi:hypothetical protein
VAQVAAASTAEVGLGVEASGAGDHTAADLRSAEDLRLHGEVLARVLLHQVRREVVPGGLAKAAPPVVHGRRLPHGVRVLRSELVDLGPLDVVLGEHVLDDDWLDFLLLGGLSGVRGSSVLGRRLGVFVDPLLSCLFPFRGLPVVGH